MNTMENLDEGKEYASFFIQFLGSSLTMLLIVIFREQTPTNNFGNWWWASIFVFAFVFMINIVFKYMKGLKLSHGFFQMILLSILFTIVSIVLNSVWRYGSFWYGGYFESPKAFFGSEIMIGVILSLSASVLLMYAPYPSKNKKIECHYDTICPKYCTDHS